MTALCKHKSSHVICWLSNAKVCRVCCVAWNFPNYNHLPSITSPHLNKKQTKNEEEERSTKMVGGGGGGGGAE